MLSLFHNEIPFRVWPALNCKTSFLVHDDVMKWIHFPHYWSSVRGIHRSPVNSRHRGQWRGALMFALICAWIYGWVNNRESGDLRRHRAHCDVIVMKGGSMIIFTTAYQCFFLVTQFKTVSISFSYQSNKHIMKTKLPSLSILSLQHFIT